MGSGMSGLHDITIDYALFRGANREAYIAGFDEIQRKADAGYYRNEADYFRDLDFHQNKYGYYYRRDRYGNYLGRVFDEDDPVKRW